MPQKPILIAISGENLDKALKQRDPLSLGIDGHEIDTLFVVYSSAAAPLTTAQLIRDHTNVISAGVAFEAGPVYNIITPNQVHLMERQFAVEKVSNFEEMHNAVKMLAQKKQQPTA